MNKGWKKLKVCRADLQLGPTLGGGQSFRWKNVETHNWIGVFRNKVWILSQEDNHLLYKAFDKASNSDMSKQNEHYDSADKEVENMVKSYFRLDVNLNHYYKVWAEADPYFREAAPRMFGVRILNQDVIENIFSFICSSNNNIKRISSMIEKLCELYGDEITEVNNKMFHSFPTIERLSGSTVESDLKSAGFGYRAKFIYRSACLIKEMGGSVWLENLKLLPYKEAKRELMKLPGIGAKVADCICLMSLGHMAAVPVDTHIFQVAVKTYLPHLQKYKTLTDKVYNEIGDHFRALHGPYAGWANTVLAKRGGSSEEDRNGYDVVQVWPHHKPGHGPKPHKFKGPKYQYLVYGRPEYQQPQYYPQYPQGPQYPQDLHYPQGPQYPQGSHYPQYPQYPQVPQYPQQQEQGFSAAAVHQYVDGIQQKMTEFTIKAYKEFQKIENEINRNSKYMEDSMKNQFQTLELALENKQYKEVQQAVKDGKDEQKIQDCLAEEENAFRTEMNADIQRTVDCVTDATETARKSLNNARNTFTESSYIASKESRALAQKMRECADKGDFRCVKENQSRLEDKIETSVQEGKLYFQKIQEFPQRQNIQTEYCRENFNDDLKDMKEAYSKMVKRCVVASETQKPEEEYEKPSINAEVKPEVEVQA